VRGLRVARPRPAPALPADHASGGAGRPGSRASRAHRHRRASCPSAARLRRHELPPVRAEPPVGSLSRAFRRRGGASCRPQLRELVPCHCTATGKALPGRVRGKPAVVLVRRPNLRSAVTQLLLDAKTGAVVHSYQWPPRSFGDSPEIDWGTSGRIAIAWTRHGSVWAVPPRGGSFEPITFPRSPGPWSGTDFAVTFSPSGHTVAVSRTEGRRGSFLEEPPTRYGIWRTSTRKPHRARRVIVSRRWELSSPVFSPDGRQIAFFDVYGLSVVPASGAGPSRRLLRTDGVSYDSSIDWQPIPRRRGQR
jgi:WD40-like Beta Propeller Repeat